ncbi:T7SS effector LXG polymorphic toxin [Priestia aryabhattai]|uniref:T7SS effector LXG polymorphic toxin n=1 Tax=Priestia aryabhattai TaxID=412384 RepID=UPI00203D4487|nr:T7SS effector LXG polymorphic toxin [Priestia aryabhattai]MCM2977038.1 T7SS effector LXG polymorphic toxin [Priestia aryabhattai]
MGKVYDAKALFDVAKDREKAYDELLSQLGELKKALQGVADLDGSLEGKGADNIKSFYKQHADTAGQWENLIKMQQSYFSTLHVKAEKAKLSGSTIVTESFLETELKNANSNAKEMVAQQHDDLQSILNGIDDIVSISAFSTSEFNDKIEEAEKKRTDTIEAVNQLDAEWSKEYSEMDDFYAVVDTLVSGLELATSQGGSVYQLAFDEKAYHDSELYKVQTKLNDYATSYVDYNKQQEEVYELEKKQEEEANKPWYEKTWDAVSTFTGEVSGYYDYKRAAEGVDPVTGEKLSTSQRVAAGAMAAAGFIPVVGWVGRAAKGGKAIYKTAKGLSAADHALDAYKSAKSFKVLEQTEKGLYGLVAANGLGEYMTGRDMFGNKISEEQRKASLLQALGIAGAGALSTKVAGKMGQSLATKGTEKLNNMRNTLRTSAVANVTKQAYQSVKNAPASWTQSLHKTYNNILDSSMPRLMPELVPAGPALAQQTVRETLQNVKQQTMQMIGKVTYDPIHNRYRRADGRFMSKRDVEKLGDSVKVETVKKVDEPVKVEHVSERSIQKDIRGTGDIYRSEIDEVIKNDYDINGNFINRSIVPKGYESVEDFLKVVDDTTIKEHGYDSIEEFKAVVGHVDDYLNASPKNNIVNKGLAGGKHVKGVDYDVLGFPIFRGDDVKFSMKLKESLFKATDDRQFKECTGLLKEAIGHEEISKDIFTSKQLRDIENGEARIKGLTWHHHQVPGKMQLVVSKTHKVNHLGGNKLWGDGIR